MEYMLLAYSDEAAKADGPQPGTPEFAEFMGAWMGFNQRLIDGGHWVSGASLEPTTTASTVRRSSPTDTAITDGPYTETKEQLGGFYLISAEDLDQALEIASWVPIPAGAVEVRPVAFRPDA